MYKIGEFSVLSKTTIKTLRYYEKEGLFKPSFVDDNGYRYYESNKLLELTNIIVLRQIGLSIEEIKKVKDGAKLKNLLLEKQNQFENLLNEYTFKISKIKYLLGEENMKYEIIFKELPAYDVYYKEGVVESFDCLTNFILTSANECLELNPHLKCVEPDYCFVEYLDGEYRENNIKVRYCQAVEKMGKGNDVIKFKKLKSVKAVCLYHKGSYANLREAYAFIMEYIEKNNLKISAPPRERYIDGIWNKDDENEWLTEIQVPVEV